LAPPPLPEERRRSHRRPDFRLCFHRPDHHSPANAPGHLTEPGAGLRAALRGGDEIWSAVPADLCWSASAIPNVGTRGKAACPQASRSPAHHSPRSWCGGWLVQPRSHVDEGIADDCDTHGSPAVPMGRLRPHQAVLQTCYRLGFPSEKCQVLISALQTAGPQFCPDQNRYCTLYAALETLVVPLPVG